MLVLALTTKCDRCRGLGKTAQSIAVLEYQRQLCHVPGPFLVVAPLTTLGHWQREIQTWTPMVRSLAAAWQCPSRAQCTCCLSYPDGQTLAYKIPQGMLRDSRGAKPASCELNICKHIGLHVKLSPAC